MSQTSSGPSSKLRDDVPLSTTVAARLPENSRRYFREEQRAWLKAQSTQREVEYLPTRSLLPGLWGATAQGPTRALGQADEQPLVER
ncbi:MAG: hypothetical protein ACREO3_10890 [Arenimonas sp.]